MRNREHDITLPFEVAEQILESTDQITMLKKDGVWTGEIINKSEIVATHRDYDQERHENYNEKQLPEPKTKPISKEKFKSLYKSLK